MALANWLTPVEPECDNDDSPAVEEILGRIEDVPPGT